MRTLLTSLIDIVGSRNLCAYVIMFINCCATVNSIICTRCQISFVQNWYKVFLLCPKKVQKSACVSFSQPYRVYNHPTDTKSTAKRKVEVMAAHVEEEIHVRWVLAQWANAQANNKAATPHCSFCQQQNQHWFNHWHSGEVLNICHPCFQAFSFLQCVNCLGVGTIYDMTQHQPREKLCPNCQRTRPAFGIQ
jgi:hypothetical protein